MANLSCHRLATGDGLHPTIGNGTGNSGQVQRVGNELLGSVGSGRHGRYEHDKHDGTAREQREEMRLLVPKRSWLLSHFHAVKSFGFQDAIASRSSSEGKGFVAIAPARSTCPVGAPFSADPLFPNPFRPRNASVPPLAEFPGCLLFFSHLTVAFFTRRRAHFPSMAHKYVHTYIGVSWCASLSSKFM
jgi:hypothetical protein